MSESLTLLLSRLRDGDPDALDRAVPLVYDDLRVIARRQRRRGGAHETLNTTALVHEAFMRLARRDADYRDRGHFFAVAAVAMRQLLLDEAKKHARSKRGGGARPLSLDGVELRVEDQAEFLLALDAALDRLREDEARACRVFECRYFAGLGEEEVAEALGISARTARREWAKAKVRLADDLGLAGS